MPQNPLLGPPLPAFFDIRWKAKPEPKEPEKPPIEVLKPTAPPQIFEQ